MIMTKEHALRDLRLIRDNFYELDDVQIDQRNGVLLPGTPLQYTYDKQINPNINNKIKQIKNQECGVCVGSWIASFFNKDWNWDYKEGKVFYIDLMKCLGFTYLESVVLLANLAFLEKPPDWTANDPFGVRKWDEHPAVVFDQLITYVENFLGV